VLTLEPVLSAVDRKTLCPKTIAGVDLPEGAKVLLALGAASREEAEAGGRRHGGLGIGSTRCHASHLVRETLKVVVEEWASRVGHPEITDLDYVPEIW
jgi:cytochrome P450